MTTTSLESGIATLKSEIGFLQRELEKLERQLEKQKSIEFITVNRITRADVRLSSGDDIPYFGYIGAFATWLRDNTTKNWAEWNGRIYRTSDLVAGRMPDMPACVDDLPR